MSLLTSVSGALLKKKYRADRYHLAATVQLNHTITYNQLTVRLLKNTDTTFAKMELKQLFTSVK
jgi:hypothetical protein